MRYLTAILALCGSLYAQTPASWWAQADSSQKARADKIYEYGFNYGDKGHTAVTLGWTETSLGADSTHDEDSQKDFGLSEIALLDIGCTIATYDSLERCLLTLDRQTGLALDYFFLCNKRLLATGLSPADAYFWSYPRYSTGNKWRRFRGRGEVFQSRVRFLTRIFK